jgi:hypothetical protein
VYVNQFIKWPSIGQFRHLVAALRYRFQHTGALDATGEPVLDSTRPLPKLRFKGTVKMHGCNASMVYAPQSGAMYYQGREITLDSAQTNFGFFLHAQKHEALLKNLCERFYAALTEETNSFLAAYPDAPLVVYGEWCGRGIQKKCALHQLEPMFVAFRVGLAGPLADDVSSSERPFLWLADEKVLQCMEDPALKAARFFCTDQFPTYSREFDFNAVQGVLESACLLTATVEQCCPVGAAFGVQGIGEGIVWRCQEEGFEHPRFWFKTKGEAHKVSKVKDEVEANPEEAANIAQFVKKTVTTERLAQARSYLEARNLPFNQLAIGEFIRWVCQDILKEEADLIAAAGTDVKKLTKFINLETKAWLRQQPDFDIQ